MSEAKKKRTRTGCMTCRSRRVKCDERRPSCARCETANVQCAGYEEPRIVVGNKHKRRKSSSTSPATLSNPDSSAAKSPEPRDLSSLKPQFPLIAFPNNPADYQVPHPRAREVLGHQQFAARTVNLLFRHDHLPFWRDQLMQTAWDTEYVFDAIIAVGNMHRSVLILSRPNDQYRGTEMKIVALEYYGRTLQQITDIYAHDYGKTSETLIAVLLLLTLFECFANNVTGALRHLCVAQQHLSSLEALHAVDGISLPNRDALVACANDLALTARLVLPLAPITLSLSIDMMVPQTMFGGAADVDEEYQQLISLIRTDSVFRAACWQPLSEKEASLRVPDIVAFQEALKRWKDSAVHTLQDMMTSDVQPDTAFDTALTPGVDLKVPPSPKCFRSLKAALGMTIFNAYMGRTMWIRWQLGDEDDEFCADQADRHAYDIFRIAKGLWAENDQRPLEQRIYLPCERIQIGLTPLMYLGIHFCRQPVWNAWAKDVLRCVAEEGIYNSLALATALDFGQQLEQTDTARPAVPSADATRRTTSMLILPDTEGRRFVAYLLERHSSVPYHGHYSVRIAGCARWTSDFNAAPGNVELSHFGPDHLLNKTALMRCPYKRLRVYEPFALEWEALLAQPTYSPADYLPDDFDLSSIFGTGVNNSVPALGVPT